jgi:hypothetical protein
MDDTDIEIDEPDQDQADADLGPDICGACSGSGEGRWEGSSCRTCRGTGEV